MKKTMMNNLGEHSKGNEGSRIYVKPAVMKYGVASRASGSSKPCDQYAAAYNYGCGSPFGTDYYYH